MTMPATTGQLRTKISDMEIGDYIPCRFYYDKTNSQMAFMGLGTPPSTIAPEFPFTGNASGFGSFYFLKSAKGLLIADRVLVHSVSWNTINANRFIQGIPVLVVNKVPALTTSDNGSDGGRVIYSNQYNSGNEAAKNLFNPDQGYWNTGTSVLSQWVGYIFGEPQVVNAVGFTDFNSSVYTSNVSVQATSDGSTWNITLANASYSSSGTKVITFNNSTAYLGYRLVINGYVGGWIALRAGLYFGECKDAITARSLTGGVAYADGQGNLSTTEKENGAWPVNNEWDKYVVNFPNHLIRPDKTLNDVFHFLDVSTWCQDTPSLSMPSAVNSARVGRGHLNAKEFGYILSSNVTASLACFRPVFEYKEL